MGSTGLSATLEGFNPAAGEADERPDSVAIRRTMTQPRAAGRAALPRAARSSREALEEVRALLGERERRRDLLIEHLHLIQDRYGHLSAAHLAALAQEMKLALTEVYEVATFYAHFDVVKEGETPPPAVTVRVCDSLVLRHGGGGASPARPAGQARPRCARACARPAWAPATARRSARSAMCR